MAIDEKTQMDWEGRYQAGRTGWDRGKPSGSIDVWFDADLQAGKSILVPGCGRGHEIVPLVERGLQVTAIDIAPSAVAAVKASLTACGLSATVIAADVFEWQPDKPFDAIFEQTCLCALHPGEWSHYSQRLFSWLKPGGILYAQFIQVEWEGGPPFNCDLGVMRTLFDGERWQWLDDEPLVLKHPDGLYELGYRIKRV